MFSQETISRVIKPFFRHKRAKGNKGEDIACVYLKRQGFKVIVRNYQKKWGEIDIIAEKEGILHFFEVKSILVKSFTQSDDSHRPEENVHGFKIRNIRRMIETFLSESNREFTTEFRFHVLCVFMNVSIGRARVKWIPDVIL